MGRLIQKVPMKTISGRIPQDDIRRFQFICEKHQVSQSEAIRSLIHTFITEHASENEGKKKKPLNMQEPEFIKNQKETERFYENFKMMNRNKDNFTTLNSTKE